MDRRPTNISGVRVAAAMAVSLLCHAVFGLALGSYRWQPAVAAPPPILVRVLGDGGSSEPEGKGMLEPTGAPVAATSVSARSEFHQIAAAPPAARRRPLVRRAPSVAKPTREPDNPVARDADSVVDEDGIASAPPGAMGGESVGSGGGAGAPGTGAGNGVGGGGGGSDGLRAWCSSCPIPDYPPRARREGWQGTVEVDLRVSSDGTVAQASVGRSSGFALLDSAAVTVARRSRFRLPEGGEGLRGQLRYRFVLEGTVTERSL